jgi:hypothetical protein
MFDIDLLESFGEECRTFLEITVSSTTGIHKFINKVRFTGSLLDKEPPKITAYALRLWKRIRAELEHRLETISRQGDEAANFDVFKQYRKYMQGRYFQHLGKFIILFLWSDTWLVSGKIFQRLAACHAVPAGSQDESVAYNQTGRRTLGSRDLLNFCWQCVGANNLASRRRIFILLIHWCRVDYVCCMDSKNVRIMTYKVSDRGLL